MSWGAIAGGGISAIGGMLGGGGSKPRFNQSTALRNVEGIGGNVGVELGFKGRPNTISMSLSGANQALYDQFLQQAQMQAMMGVPGLPGLTQGLAGQTSLMGATGLPQYAADYLNFNPVNTLAGANLFQNQNLALAGMFGNTGQAGLERAFSTPGAAPLSGALAQLGLGLAGQDFNSTQAAELAALRAQAQPFEERAVNSKVQSLFNRGVLSSTQGAQAMGELAMTQQMADIERQRAARTLGMDLMGQNRQFAQGLFGQALQGIGLDQDIGARLGLLGMQGLQQVPGLFSANFDTAGAVDQALLSRAQQRMQGAEALFGFGSGLNQQFMTDALRYLGGAQGIEAGLFKQAGMVDPSGGGSSYLPASGPSTGDVALQGLFAGLGSGVSTYFDNRAANKTPTAPTGGGGAAWTGLWG